MLKPSAVLAVALLTALTVASAPAAAHGARVADYTVLQGGMPLGSAVLLSVNGNLRIGIGNVDSWWFTFVRESTGPLSLRLVDDCYMRGSVETGFALDPELGCLLTTTAWIEGTGHGANELPGLDRHVVQIHYNGVTYLAELNAV